MAAVAEFSLWLPSGGGRDEKPPVTTTHAHTGPAPRSSMSLTTVSA